MLIVPNVEFPPRMPFTSQVKRVSDVFETVAENWRVLWILTVATAGETDTLTGSSLTTAMLKISDTWPSGFPTVTGTELETADVDPLAVSSRPFT